METPQVSDHGAESHRQEMNTPSNSVEGIGSDTSNAEASEPPAKVSVLQKFLAVRGLTSTVKTRRKPLDLLKPSKLTGELLSKTYTQRRHGQRMLMQRVALREPEDLFIDSVNAYVPKKRQQQLLHVHQDEKEVNEAYVTATRALFFEREVLDKVVCDREENRSVYEERLWQLLLKERGLQEIDDGEEENNQQRVAVSNEK